MAAPIEWNGARAIGVASHRIRAEADEVRATTAAMEQAIETMEKMKAKYLDLQVFAAHAHADVLILLAALEESSHSNRAEVRTIRKRYLGEG